MRTLCLMQTQEAKNKILKTTLQAQATTAPKELNKSDILSQIYNKLDNMKEDSNTKITIILKPENLGKINLYNLRDNEEIRAFVTSSRTAKRSGELSSTLSLARV